MAEIIGSLGVTIEVDDINAAKVAETVAGAINATAEAADTAGQAMDGLSDKIKETADTASDSAGGMAKTVTKAVNDITESVAEADLSPLTEGIENTNTAIATTTAETAETADGMQSLAAQIKNVQAEMARLALAGEAESEQYNELTLKLGELLDIRGDIAAQGAIFSNDDMNINAVNQGISTYQNSLSLLGDTLGLVAGGENNIASAASAFNDVAKIGNTIQEISNSLNQDGYIKRVLLTKITQAQTAVQNSLTTALGGSATAANIAKVAMYGLTAAVAAATLGLPFLIMGVQKLIEKWQAGRKAQEEMAKAIGDAVSENVAQIRILQGEWNALGEDLKKKEQFIRDNQDAFDDLGVSINNINEAENLLVRNTEKYISAIMARAKAAAAQSQLADKYAEQIQDRAEIEQKIAEKRARIAKAEKDIETSQSFMNRADRTEYMKGLDRESIARSRAFINQANKQIEDYNKEIAKIEQEFNKENAGLINLIAQAEKDAENAMREAGVTELSEFTAMLKKKETAYKNYTEALNSTDETVRKSATMDLSGGKTYLEYLKNLRAATTEAGKLKVINEEIAKLTQKSTKDTKDKTEKEKEELTQYEQMKEALKVYDELRNKGVDPKTFEIEEKNLKKQIADYERIHHLVELPKQDFTERIERMREFSDKLVSIVEANRDKIAEIDKDATMGQTEKDELKAGILQFQQSDIEMLKAEYGIYGEDLITAMLSGMNEAVEQNRGELSQRIIQLRQDIDNLSQETTEKGNQVDNSQKIAQLQVQLGALLAEYDRLKKGIANTTEAQKKLRDEQKKAAFDKLKKGISSLASEFVNLGEQIGGRAGESLEFLGGLTNTVMATISNIQQFCEIVTKSIEGVSKATATAIKAVESASVILAVISAAMEIAMKLVELFRKDKETYADKKSVYDAYVSTLDTIIDRERELTATLEAQQAVAQYDAIGELIGKQDESTRRIAKEYLNNRERGEHTAGKKQTEKLNASDWAELQNAIGRTAADSIKSRGRLTGIFDLSAEDLKKVQTQATGFYSKLDDETRGFIERVIAYDDAMAQNVEDKMAQLNGMTFDELSDNFLSSLMEMDASAADISKNIQDYMRRALITDMFKSQYAGELKKYYEKWASAMENDGIIDTDEQIELDTIRTAIVNGATAAAQAINDQFRDTTEEIEEQGLSGAIKGASQESIDLLTGQTNAVRMNQVEAMAIAREQLTAVLNIDRNLSACTTILNDIRAVIRDSGNNMRAKGIT